MPNGLEDESRFYADDVESRGNNEDYYRQRLEGGAQLFQEALNKQYNPEVFTHAFRKLMAGQEVLIAQGQEPDQWTFKVTRNTLDNRKAALSLEQYPNLSVVGEFAELGLVFDRDRQEVVKMIDAVDGAKDELFARWTILEALNKQLKMSTDLENYALKYFLANWATWPEARHYGIIGNLGPSPIIPERNPTLVSELEPGAEVPGFGKIVDTALRYWDDISLGKAEDDGVGNIFAEETFQDQIDKATEWIIRKLEADVGYDLPDDEKERLSSLGYQELAEATNLAYIIFRQTDMDVTRSYRQSGETKSGSVYDVLMDLPEGLDVYKLEVGPLSKDTAKLAWWVLRTIAEVGREYPAAMGLPLLAGKFPNLTTDFWRMIRISRETDADHPDEEGLEKAKQSTTLYKLWKECGVQLGDLPWDVKEWQEGGEVFRQNMTDADEEGRTRVWKEPQGIAKVAFWVPYFLEVFAAYKGIYSTITNNNVAETYQLFQNPNALRKLNKQWTLVFNMMARDDLGEGTTRRVSQLSKCVLIGSAIVANSSLTLSNPDFSREKTDYDVYLVPDDVAKRPAEKKSDLNKMLRIGKQAAFLTRPRRKELKDDERTQEQLSELEEETIRWIVDNRTALTPGEASHVIRTRSGKTWFTDEELQAIAETDLYRPFGAQATEKRRPKTT